MSYAFDPFLRARTLALFFQVARHQGALWFLAQHTGVA